MFSQLLFVRFRAAEKALRDGRLDEAYRLAMAPDLREHRRGAAVLAALAERFLERARGHYRADRFAEALMDLDRAEAGGGLKDEIAELRKYVQTVAAEHRRNEASRRGRLDAAVRRIEGGSLAAGRKLLEEASASDRAAANLRQTVEQRAEEAMRIVEHAEQLLTAGQLAAAAERVRRAKAVDAHHQAVTRVESQLCQRVLENARTALLQGKVSRAADELACLNELGKALPARRELADLVALAQQAGECVRVGQYAEARRHAMSLARQLPEAKWVTAVSDQVRQMEELHTALCAGPLGDRVDEDAARKAGLGRRVRPVATRENGENPAGRAGCAQGSPAKLDLNDTLPLPGRLTGEGGLPERLLLLVDGGGSFLVLRGAAASVGRAASDDPADVPIFSDAAERHANIQRMDDDYFLFSAKEVEVAGRPVQHALLRDGDKVMLGRKAKFTFRLPSRKSATAVLEMSDTTKMPNDVRRVVLLHHHASIGNGPGAHIPCRHAGVPLVLYERDGALWVRPRSDGHVDTEPKELRLGEQVEMCGASLVLERWKSPTSGTRV